MKAARCTDQLVIRFLKQAEAGMPIKDICRSGGMEASVVARLRDLEAENNKLKKLPAKSHLDIHWLKSDFGVM